MIKETNKMEVPELARRAHILASLDLFFENIRYVPNAIRNRWIPEALKKGLEIDGVDDYADKLEKKIKKINKIHKKAYVQKLEDYCPEATLDLYINLAVVYAEIEEQIKKDGPVGKSLCYTEKRIEKYKNDKDTIEERLSYDIDAIEEKAILEASCEENLEYEDLDDETTMEGCRRASDRKILED